MPLGITRKRPSSTKMAGKNKLLRAGFLEMIQDGGLDSPLVRGQARRREQEPWE